LDRARRRVVLPRRGVTRLTAERVSGAAEFSGWPGSPHSCWRRTRCFLSARSLIKVLMIVHALVWNTPRTKLKNATRSSVGFIALVTALVALSIVAVELGEPFQVRPALDARGVHGCPVRRVVVRIDVAPHRDCPLIALAPGALLFAIGMEALHIATVVGSRTTSRARAMCTARSACRSHSCCWAYLLVAHHLAAVLNSALWNPVRLRVAASAPDPPAQVVAHPFVDAYIDRAWKALFGDLDPAARADRRERNRGVTPELPASNASAVLALTARHRADDRADLADQVGGEAGAVGVLLDRVPRPRRCRRSTTLSVVTKLSTHWTRGAMSASTELDLTEMVCSSAGVRFPAPGTLRSIRYFGMFCAPLSSVG
jgi:hypothetical protein